MVITPDHPLAEREQEEGPNQNSTPYQQEAAREVVHVPKKWVPYSWGGMLGS